MLIRTNICADIKLDNVQLTLPENQEKYLDAFCAESQASSSPNYSTTNDGRRIFAYREMRHDQLGFPILCDLGSVVFVEKGYPGLVQAIPSRTPEVILGAEWGCEIDVWTLGVLVCLFGV